jgi:hypothetical protein
MAILSFFLLRILLKGEWKVAVPRSGHSGALVTIIALNPAITMYYSARNVQTFSAD